MAKKTQKGYKITRGILGPVSGTYEFLQITKNGVLRFVKKKVLTSRIT